MRTRRAIVLALLAPLALSVTACGDQLERKPADKEIIIYSGRGKSLVQSLFDDFTAQTGIKVVVRYGGTSAMAAQLIEEGERSPADLFLAQDAGALGAVAKQGMFAQLPAEVLNQVAEPYRARNGEWVGLTGRSRVLAYNESLVSAEELPSSVFELIEPRWRGNVGVAPANGSFQAFVTALRVQHGDDKARDFLTGLKANDAKILENNIAIMAEVESGKLATGLVNHYYLYENAKEQGIPAEQLNAKLHFFPDGDIGALVNVSGVGVLKHGDEAIDPDVQAFLDFALGVAGQTYFAQQTSEYPLAAGVQPAAAGLPPLSELDVPDIDLNDLDTLAATVDMIKDSGLA